MSQSSPQAPKTNRRLAALILSGCTCLLCLYMGLSAYFESEKSPSVEPSVVIAVEEPVVNEFSLQEGTVVAQESSVEPTLPEIPLPEVPPVNPVPPKSPQTEVKEVIEPKTRTHVVAKGDTLSSISLEYYGSANRWQEIYKANKGSIPNKNSIKIGTVLTIP